MSAPAPETLFWLPPPPADFRARLKAAGDATELHRLAAHALDINQLLQLAKAADRCIGGGDGAFSPVRLALLSNATTDYLAPAIAASGLRHGVRAQVWRPDFGTALPSLLHGPELTDFAPDVALLAFDHRALGLDRDRLDGDDAVAAALDVAGRMLTRVHALGAQSIVATIAAPPSPWCGHLDARLPGSVAAQVAAFNAGLLALVADHGALLFDVAALAGAVGGARWHDPAQWNSAKLPFALEMTPLYADHVGRLLGAVRGKSRKCLVLDLDNTLWGGVIGDDGVEGIALGAGSAKGEAFLAIQAYALALRARGVVLAVCSKNEDDAARLPFRHYSEMLLREDDIAAFVANWDDKATNLTRIASMLNIGVDALLFLDDNPAERARVRQMLPQVAVPELPDDPAYYPAAIAQGGWFEALTLSADDVGRAEQYRANAERAAAMETLGDIDSYHRSLAMVCTIAPFDAAGRSRIAQLINKSNQYNLTSRRYTEADVAAIADDQGKFALQIRLADRFGDNGMISVLIFDRADDVWMCDTWLMSCRVLGRRVEEAALSVVAAAARAAGARWLEGEYIPSAKNRMVADHWARLGFARVEEREDGRSRWRLALADYAPPDLPMQVEDRRPSVDAGVTMVA